MVFSTLSKANKIRRIATIVTLISGFAAGTIGAISFIGYTPDNFTIALKPQGVRLAMDVNPDLAHPTTFLEIEDYPAFSAFSYSSILDTYGYQLDNSATNNKAIGIAGDGEHENTLFFKHTFYLKNLGDAPADFTFAVNVVDNAKPTNSTYGFDSIVRVMIFDNDGFDEESHEHEVYAKAAEYKSSADIPIVDGVKETREKVAHGIEKYATSFESSKVICTRKYHSFMPGQLRRFTFVSWLEGSDPQCSGNAFADGSFQLGIFIDGQQG